MISLYKGTDQYGGRIVADYELIDRAFPFYIGKVVYKKNSVPLFPEILPSAFEITYQLKGRQTYEVLGSTYVVNAGQAFVTLPNEEHSTGGIPFDKSKFFYMIIKMEQFGPGCLGSTPEETACLVKSFKETFIKKRIVTLGSRGGRYFERLIDLYEENTPFKKTILRNTITDLLLYMIDCAQKEIACGESVFQPVLQYIGEHITEFISLDDLAAMVDMSKPRFQAKFKEELCFPPREYIIREKIKYAEKMLRTTDQTVTDIALSLGFSSSQYFSSAFKQYTTFTPMEYKKVMTQRQASHERK